MGRGGTELRWCCWSLLLREAMQTVWRLLRNRPARSWSGNAVPLVRFNNGAEESILPSLFSTQVANTGECRRVQVPLKLAWVSRSMVFARMGVGVRRSVCCVQRQIDGQAGR